MMERFAAVEHPLFFLSLSFFFFFFVKKKKIET
jgi:hypothetical protein